MPRFELEFGTCFDDGSGGIINSSLVKRVIFAENERIAEEMGKTMLWERVAKSDYLYRLTCVRKVSDSVEYTSFCDVGSPAWANMLIRMGLRPSDVEYVLEENKDKVFIVGFRLKKTKPKPMDKR